MTLSPPPGHSKGSRPRTIAMVSQVPIFPTTAGNRGRILTLVQALQGLGHQVIYLQIPSGPYDAPGSVEQHEALLGRGNYIDLRQVSVPGRIWQWLRVFPVRAVSGLSKLAGIKTDWRYWRPLDCRMPPETARQLRRIIHDRGCDCCVVEYVFHSAVLDGLDPAILRLIDTHDLFTNRHAGYAANGLGGDYWVSLRPGAEARGLRRADAVLAIQEAEAQAFATLLASHPQSPGVGPPVLPQVRVVSHFLPAAARPATPGPSHRAAFVASSNVANLQALERFLALALPHVLKRDPAFRLVLAGSICPAVPDHPAVEKYGRFERIEDVFARAPVSLNPVLSGSGISIKALESLACGAPVVATATGARGLETLAGKGLRILPDGDWPAFADALCDLTLEAARRGVAAQAAHQAAAGWSAGQRAALVLALETRPRAAVGKS